MREAIERLIRAAREAALATTRDDDPANLPSDVLQELWEAIRIGEDAIAPESTT